MRLRIAARSSDLARIQALQVGRALKAVDPSIDIHFEFRMSLGDQNLDVPLDGLGSKGVFTQDFFEDLKAGRFDAVVHSWKDLPTEDRPGTKIIATLPRADVRDLLLVPKLVWEQALTTRHLPVLSSSPRRAHNLRDLKNLLPGQLQGVEFRTVRGNVPTRIEKMFRERAALVLAKAGLDRLLEAPETEFAPTQSRLRELLKQCRFVVLPLSVDPPAAAQGALAIEIADGKSELEALFQKINSVADFNAVRIERQILQGYGGGCHQKIGVSILPKPYGEWRVVSGVTDQGLVLNENNLQTNDKIPTASDSDHVFPLLPAQNAWFNREELSAQPIKADALWVARADAWPQNTHFEGIVWASGLKSWQKLAHQGVWVHGCSESLGEEDTRLQTLCPNLKWQKLTHVGAMEISTMPTVATYQLAPKSLETSPDLTGKTHFFWMSSSSYARARELYPKEVDDGYHGCGPGLTYDYLRRQNLRNSPHVFLKLDDFLKAVLPESQP